MVVVVKNQLMKDWSRRDFIKAGAAVGATAATASFSNFAYSDSPRVLNYLAWPGNADPYVIAEFEKAHNVKVRIKEYVGGDQMLALLHQAPPGSFDVVMADAEYMHLLKEADFLQKLNPDDYPLDDYWPEFQKFPLHWFDGDLYSVMTDFGYLGLSYNTEVFRPEELESYDVMWSDKAKGKVGFFDFYLPSMGCVSLAAGNKTPFDLTGAGFDLMSNKLMSLRGQASGFYTIADIFSSFSNRQATLIPGIGEWITLGLRESGVPVDTIIPNEGGLQWTESMSILKSSPKQDLAREFIQWTTSPKGQVLMATKPDNKKSIPSKAGWELLNKTMPAEAELLRMQLNAPNVIDEFRTKKIAYRQLPSNQSIETWNDLWTDFKSA
jgi:spermidine/putrescine transport system substrate-binding protein